VTVLSHCSIATWHKFSSRGYSSLKVVGVESFRWAEESEGTTRQRPLRARVGFCNSRLFLVTSQYKCSIEYTTEGHSERECPLTIL
jgi:hypothetical protein